MDSKQVGWMLIGVLFSMSFTIDVVRGKCNGRWAIHSCLGGNKRSDIDGYNSENSRSALESTFLKKLLSHNTLSGSLLRAIRRQLRGSPRSSPLSSPETRLSKSDLQSLIHRLKES